MSLADYKYELESCTRCSHCKFIPWPVMQSRRFSRGCPSADNKKFHAYSASGKIEIALSLLEGRLDNWTPEMQEVVYNCHMCGCCQMACRPNNFLLCDHEEIFLELRMRAIESGYILPEQMILIDSLKQNDNPFGQSREKRSDWANGLDLINLDDPARQADVIFHAGCRFSYHKQQWGTIRNAVQLIRESGKKVGIFKSTESCCGGRAYELGFKSVLKTFAEDTVSRIKSSKSQTLITACGDCYGTFKNLYLQANTPIDNIQIYHISEYLETCLDAGTIQPKKKKKKRVTYHDPCHLGRKGEQVSPWNGEWKLTGSHIYEPVPEKPLKIGINGCYDPPRNVIKAFPELEFVEMERIREYSWCCGSGAGVREVFPEFAKWTARERIEEAKSIDAEVIITACGWCESILKETADVNGESIEIVDITDLFFGGGGI